MAEQGVTVEYIGRKKDYKYKGHEFPCRMSVATAKALIERNPKTFKSDELSDLMVREEEQFEVELEVDEDENSNEE